MRLFISKNKRYIFYGLYSVILLTSLLYFRFPSDAFKGYLQATANRVSPENVLLIGEVQPAFPVGVKLLETRLSPRSNPDTSFFAVNSILIRPEIWSFLLGRLNLNFSCDVNDGFLRGNVHFVEKKTGCPFKTSIEFKGIRIAESSYLSSLIGCNLNGILGGALTYSTGDEKLIRGAGEADFSITDGRITFSQPILVFNSIEFEDLSIKCVMEKEKLRLNNFKLQGQEMNGTLSGEIILKSDISKSAIDITGAIELSPAFFKNRKDSSDFLGFFKRSMKNGRLSFILTGNISEPRFRLL